MPLPPKLSVPVQPVKSSEAEILFDEADALFGKRTTVRDSHDRYADDNLDQAPENPSGKPPSAS